MTKTYGKEFTLKQFITVFENRFKSGAYLDSWDSISNTVIPDLIAAAERQEKMDTILRNYIRECDNPVPDLALRRNYLNQLRAILRGERGNQ